MKINSFEDLEIYQMSLNLAIRIYKLTNLLPKDEKFIIRDQIIRAVNSIGANIAEGFGRNTTKDFIHFLHNARGSLMEVRHFLNLIIELHYIESNNTSEIQDLCNTLGIKINNLIKSLKNKL